ncbi:MAG: hypothetical protein LBD77_04205 [Bifidobacteriaceae bacterium]|jgi:hypothetical protein|nr:hypothetical protein [Bifidobacteriaceae bacterium]
MTADPSRLIDIATGYMASKTLFGAARVGLFQAVADGADTVEAAAAAIGRSQRQTRILLDGVHASGLMTRSNGRYALEADARDYLTGGDLDLTPFLNFLEIGSFHSFDDHWRRTVDTDQGGAFDASDEAFMTAFMAGVMRYNALHAHWFAHEFPTEGRTRVLDFGGFTAGWSIELMRRNPDLTVTFAYPDSTALRADVEAAGLGGRVTFADMPTETGVPGGNHDLVLAIHVIHRFSDPENRAILAHLRTSARPGAKLAVFDFFHDTSSAQRDLDARHAAEYINFDGTVVWPEETVVSWLDEAGWSFEGYVPVPGSPRVLVARAV